MDAASTPATVDLATSVVLAIKESPVPPTTSKEPFYKQGPFWITLLLAPLVYIVVYAVLFQAGFTTEIKVMVVTAIISTLLGAIIGYWLATSFQSGEKDKTIAAQTAQLTNQGDSKP